MINGSLPYRVAEDAYNAAFPDQEETLLVVVTARTEVDADRFAKDLRSRLVDNPVIKTIFAPNIHPFFEKNGLLYQTDSELDQTLANLTKAAPMLRELGREPSLNLFFERLAKGQQDLEAAALPEAELARLYGELAHTIAEVRAGNQTKLDWQRIFDGRAKEDGDLDFRKPAKRVITITPRFDFTSLNPAKEVFETVRAVATDIEAENGFDVDIGITGTQALRSEELQSVTKGVTVALITSLLMVAGLLWTALRSFKMTGIAVLVLLISVSFSLAFAAAVLPPLNLVSVAFVVLLIGLGIDFVIHLTMDILDRLSEGQSREEALSGAIDDIGPALFLAVITTALAFLSFLPTDFHGMAQLGQISAAGVLIAFAVTMMVVPCCLPYLSIPEKKTMNVSVGGRVNRLLPSLRWLVIALTALAIPFAAQMYFNSDPMSLRDPESPSVVTYLSLAEDADTTPYRLNTIVDSFEEAQRLALEAEQHPLIERAVALTRFVPENQDEKLEIIDFTGEQLEADLNRPGVGAEPQGDAIGDLIETLSGHEAGSPGYVFRSELLALSEGNDPVRMKAVEAAIFGNWSLVLDRVLGQLTPDYVEFDNLPTELVERYSTTDGRARVEFLPAEDVSDSDKRVAFLAAVKRFTSNVAGPSQVYIESGKVISRSMVEAVTIAAILVTLVLFVLVRDIFLVFIVLIPLAMAGVLTGGAAFLLGQPLNFSNVIALPLLIGLGVDSGIHLSVRRRRIEAGHNTIYQTSTPKAVTFSALTTIVAFGSLMLSAHRGTSSMGIMLALSIACILLTTLTLIPAWTDYVTARKMKLRKN